MRVTRTLANKSSQRLEQQHYPYINLLLVNYLTGNNRWTEYSRWRTGGRSIEVRGPLTPLEEGP